MWADMSAGMLEAGGSMLLLFTTVTLIVAWAMDNANRKMRGE